MLTVGFGRTSKPVIACAIIVFFSLLLLHSRRSGGYNQPLWGTRQQLQLQQPLHPSDALSLVPESYDDIDDVPVAIDQETTMWNEVTLTSRWGQMKEPFVPGFTMYERMYLLNGTFYIVTSDERKFPPKQHILSKPLEVGHGLDLTPTDQELRFIHPRDAPQILGSRAMNVKGFSIIIYDPPQFLRHFYHWWGEIMLGLWRVYASLFDATNRFNGSAKYPPAPARFLIPFARSNVEADKGWRDKAGVTAPLMRAAFPSASIQESDYWNDLNDMHTTVVFEKVMIINRESAHKHPFGSKWYKMIAGTISVTPTTAHFWEPLRQSTIRNFLGYIWDVDHETGAVSVISDPSDTNFAQGHGNANSNAKPKAKAIVSEKPIVTYISRQGGGRRLVQSDHIGLVAALQRLEDEGVCKIHVAQMEKMSLREQIDLVASSSVIVGVHGNGLTHSLWMPPTPRSTLIEIFYPPGYVFDYEMLARNMGHKHYGVWNDTLVTFPKGTYHQGVHYGEEFHGTSIPVYGPAVADIVRQRLTAKLEDLEE
ncbi:hypothetical protein AX16_009791 [Volvariella volvacea WC 439]|nr:hypothetical protein AX16_009791 [Volvariella volvacea WC 439]